MPRKFVKINIGRKIKAKVLLSGNKLKHPLVSASGHLTGHRGVAAGNLKNRTQPLERSRGQEISRGGVEHFLEGGIFVVNSSNVSTARYLVDEQEMIVSFLPEGKAYAYSNVTVQEAYSFATALSKGGWVWDHLRVRGSATAHQKPYRPMFFTEVDETDKGVASINSKYYPFVSQGQALIVDKGGVGSAVYNTAERTLIVSFQNGQAFAYANIGKDEVSAFARAKDRGAWIQRVANQKPNQRLGYYEPGPDDWQW